MMESRIESGLILTLACIKDAMEKVKWQIRHTWLTVAAKWCEAMADEIESDNKGKTNDC